MKGTIKRWLNGRGYGFIEPEAGGDDIFVHYSDITGAQEPKEGQRVEFDVQRAYKGPRAINVKLIE